jgi:PAS domain S-box-containing protein
MLDSDVIHSTIDRSAHTVLVVDDNAATRYATARVLRAAGFVTAEASSGAEALRHIAEGVSAVVLDVHLPDIDGFEVCRILRQDADTTTLPVVHLSAEFVREEDKVEGLNAGADAYLVHPVEPAVLVATLQALIRARTAEEKLRRSELRFRAIYDQALSGIVLIDAQGRIADANPAMQKLLRRSMPELIGQTLSSLAPDSWRHQIEQRLTAMRGDGIAARPWQGQLPLQDSAGRTVYLDWSISEHVEPGLRIGIASDASERYELEQKRREVLEREQAARVVAERHSRTKDDFIAVLSHELRTPLNAIVGWVAVMMRRDPTPEAIRGLSAIERNVKTQARIISDILDVSRINSGKLRLEREHIDPADTVLVSIAALRSTIEEKRIDVQTDVEGARHTAWLDPARFQQILWNLLSNAIKFSPEGGIIRVALRRDGARLILTVQDFGVGIQPEFLPHLFERFTQSDSPGNRYQGGLGLGLSIVKHLAELHGGSVAAESAGAGRGTLMRLELNVVPQPGELDTPEDSDTLPAPLTGIESHPLQGMDILVVEDDADALEMLTIVLMDRGANVRSAVDYDSAMAQCQRKFPQVLISDIGLPGKDGHELMRSVRALQAQQLVPAPRLSAIALTAFARPEDREKALVTGFDVHLAKPLKPHVLVRAIESIQLPCRNS